MNTLESLNPHETYSYADYLQWTFDERVELIVGEVSLLPTPVRCHQRILTLLAGEVAYFLKKKLCQVYITPFDVRLPLVNQKGVPDEQIFTVVQPDFCVVCDLTKLDDRGCVGAPDWVVEIISPATAKKDLNDKFNLYEAAGVREYWIVFLDSAIVSVYRLDPAGNFELVNHFEKSESIPVPILEPLVIDLQNVFE